MGRKKKKPTRVLSMRINESDYKKMKEIAKCSGKSVSQLYREMIRNNGRYT